MFKEVLPGVSGFIGCAIICTVFFTSAINAFIDSFNLKHEKQILAGCRFILPCGFSLIFALFGGIVSSEYNTIFQQFCGILAPSVFSYEAIVKRIFPRKKEEKDE